MAGTVHGRRLTEEHRQEQVRLRARFLVAFLGLWPLLGWDRLDETAPGWVQAVMTLIRPFRQESADLSVAYYGDYRLAEVPRVATPAPVIEFVRPEPRPLIVPIGQDRSVRGQAVPVRGQDGQQRGPSDRSGGSETSRGTVRDRPVRLGDELVQPRIDWSEWDKGAEKSLLVTGPGELKRRAARGETEAQAKRGGLVVVSGAASRHVLAGGRETQMELIRADDRALGYIRVTDSDPCAFCAMLASRGPVYKGRSFDASNAKSLGAGEAKVHDGCGCTIEPVLARKGNAWPGRAKEFQRLWYASTKGLSGQDAINAFRRAHEAKRRGAGVGAVAAPRAPSPRAVAGRDEQRRAQRLREVTAQIASLERSLQGLLRREAAGEDVERPLTYHRKQLKRLRAELTTLRAVA